MRYSTEKTDRIDYLKSYYMTHSKMVLKRDSTAPWKCHKSLYLYVEGWINNKYSPTVKIRRSLAEAYMLKNMNFSEGKMFHFNNFNKPFSY